MSVNSDQVIIHRIAIREYGFYVGKRCSEDLAEVLTNKSDPWNSMRMM